MKLVHKQSYAPSVTSIATLIFEDQGAAPSATEIGGYRKHIGYQLEGAEMLTGTYPFTLARSHDNYRINDFLHRLIESSHRARFLAEFDRLANNYGLTAEERELIRNRKWIEMIRRCVNFFVQMKMAAVIGVSNPEVYTAFRGETLELFLATRKVPITYSVAGKDRAQQMDRA